MVEGGVSVANVIKRDRWSTDRKTGERRSRAVYQVRWREGRRQRSQQFERRADAELFCAQAKVRLAQGLPAIPERRDPLTAEEAIARHLDHREAHGSPESARVYLSTFSQFAEWVTRGGSRRFEMTEMTPMIVEEWRCVRWRRWWLPGAAGWGSTPPPLPVVAAHTGRRAPVVGEDGSSVDFVLVPDGWAIRRPITAAGELR